MLVGIRRTHDSVRMHDTLKAVGDDEKGDIFAQFGPQRLLYHLVRLVIYGYKRGDYLTEDIFTNSRRSCTNVQHQGWFKKM